MATEPRKGAGISTTARALAIFGAVLALWLGRITWDYFDPNSPSNLTMEIQLKMFGTAMYEYHSQTGRWPTKVDDLAQTSLPAKSYVWRQTAQTIVFIWPQDLKPEPKDNANVLLAYWNGGLYNRFGRVWACWGNLRTERVKRSILPWKAKAFRPQTREGQIAGFRELLRSDSLLGPVE